MEKIDENILEKEYVNKYEYRVSFYEEKQEYLATVSEFPYASVFADSPEKALQELKETVFDFLYDKLENSEELPLPNCKKNYSGRFILRIPTGLHKRLADEAKNQNSTLNSYIATLLAERIGCFQKNM